MSGPFEYRDAPFHDPNAPAHRWLKLGTPMSVNNMGTAYEDPAGAGVLDGFQRKSFDPEDPTYNEIYGILRMNPGSPWGKYLTVNLPTWTGSEFVEKMGVPDSLEMSILFAQVVGTPWSQAFTEEDALDEIARLRRENARLAATLHFCLHGQFQEVTSESDEKDN